MGRLLPLPLLLACAALQALLVVLPERVATLGSGPLVIGSGLLAAGAAALRARSARGSLRRAWAFAALACAAFALAVLATYVSELGGRPHTDPRPLPSDLLALVASVLAPAVLLTWPRPRRSSAERLRTATDQAIVLAALLFCAWLPLLVPLARAGGSAALGVVFVGLHLVTASVAARAVEGRPGYPPELRRLALGVGALSVAMLSLTALGMVDPVAAANGLDGLFVLGALLVARAARPLPASAEAPERLRGVLPPTLPVAAALTVAAIVLVRDGGLFGAMLADGLLLVALLLGRQVLALRDNALLTERVRAREAQLSLVVESSPVGLVGFDGDGRVVLWNRAAEEVYGAGREEVVGRGAGEGARERWPELAELVAEVEREGEAPPRRVAARRADGGEARVELTGARLGDDALAVVVDVTERARLEERVERQAWHDPLTGLANRALLADRLRQALARLERHPGHVAALLLDLDRFKAVNDTAGHAMGDRLLRAVALRLRAALRPSDTLARLGGDEFVVLVDELPADPAAAAAAVERVAERVHAVVSQPVALPGLTVVPRTSVGLVMTDDPARDHVELLADADLAMYAAKRAGVGGSAAFVPELRAAAVARVAAEHELRAALERDELVVHYQPIVDLATEAPLGAEALVRWEHPERGLLGPGAFLETAEELGLMGELGRRVLRDACREVVRWNAGRAVPLTVNVNVASDQLASGTLVADVAAALQDTGCAPSWLVLELTETVVLADLPAAAATLAALKELGVGIALDDFGTGHSALAYLRTLPIDVLKLDRSFVADLDGERGTALVEVLVRLAETLGLHLVAEGIEQADHARRLAAMRCGRGQGFLYARPQPAAQVAALLAASAPPAALAA